MTRPTIGANAKVVADLRGRLDQVEAEANRTDRELETVRILLKAERRSSVELKAERDRLLAFIQRGWTEHMRFWFVHPDGTKELQPCADWCYACKVADRDRLAAIVQQARDIHRPIEGVGFLADGSYNLMPQACTACGTYDEWGIPWPCAAYRALDEALKGQP